VIAFGAAGLIYAIPLTLCNYGTLQERATWISDYPAAGLLIGALATLPLALFLRGLVQGCVVHATVSDSQSRHAGLGECLGLVMRRLLPLVAAAGLFSLGAVLGLSLLIVPGLLSFTPDSMSNCAIGKTAPGLTR